ncbi:zinc ribbon domain-containing protein [Thiococcus pfennigii]|uniref:zinc ribbon domain-containing protein n=1 Tax=Thiococcus pfennigii TaxID=1057 RepID=UPI001904794D|nr:zinc ribbon domain-containing protein [Thiococcus pfennigii]MBK1701641.1 zinc ribbon domain-containing protein [Thiococcus pfennigii]
MQCPKCHAEQADQNTICERCGIVFAKYYKYHPPEGRPAVMPLPSNRRRAAGSHWREWLLPEPAAGDPLAVWGRGLLLLVLAIWGGRLMFAPVSANAAGESFLHLINLPFHEAGHLFFRPFGQFIMTLGGTLGQLLMPAICGAVLLLKTRDPFGASVALWWFGENFLDIAPYIDDARAGVLPLIGGNFGHSAPYGFHDWEYLLTETGLIQWDHALAWFTHVSGALIMLMALAWGAVLVYRGWRVGWR